MVSFQPTRCRWWKLLHPSWMPSVRCGNLELRCFFLCDRDMYSTMLGVIKTFMSRSFYTQIGKNMLDHSLRSLRSYNFTMICCHHEPRAVLSIKNLSILSEVIIPMPLNLRLVFHISPVKMPKLSDVKAFKELLPIDTCRIWSEQDTGCQLELWF